MKLAELISPDRIKVPLVSRTKEDVLRELVGLVASTPDASDALLASILEREKKMSTGIGRGVAIPHGRRAGGDRLEIAFGVSAAPIDYSSLDGQPARIFFLLVSPLDQPSAHCDALGRIARILSQDAATGALLAAGSPGEARAILEREEDELE